MEDSTIRQLIVKAEEEGKDFIELPEGSLHQHDRHVMSNGEHFVYGMKVKFV